MTTYINKSLSKELYDSAKALPRAFDYYEVRSEIIEEFRKQDIFKDYDFDGSNLSILIDVLSYDRVQRLYNQQMFHNESFLESAKSRGDVVGRAREYGYVTRSWRASKNIIFVKIPTEESIIFLQAGTQFQATENPNLIFSTIEDYTLQNVDGYAQGEIVIFQGVLQEYQVNISEINQILLIPFNFVDMSTLQVGVKNNSQDLIFEKYQLFSNIQDTSNDAKVYFYQEAYNERYEVYFGEDTIGKRIFPGNIVRMSFITTNNFSGDGVKSFKMLNNPRAIIESDSRSFGWAPIESIKSIKLNNLNNYISQDRLVTVQDYKTLISREYPNIEYFDVWGGEDNIVPQYNTVFIAIKPYGLDKLPDAQKELIMNNLISSRKIITTNVKFTDPNLIGVNINIRYNYKDGVNLNILNNEIIIATQDYFLTNPSSRFISNSQLTKLVQNISNNITSVVAEFTLTNTIKINQIKNTRYEATFANKLISTNPIKSTAFKINDKTCYIEAVNGVLEPNSNLKDLIVYTFNEVDKKVYIANIGQIDILTGNYYIINLNNVSNEEIKLFAIPKLNDIQSFHNFILNVDLNMIRAIPSKNIIGDNL